MDRRTREHESPSSICLVVQRASHQLPGRGRVPPKLAISTVERRRTCRAEARHIYGRAMADTADARGTAQQCIELAEAGSEMVRVTVSLPEAAAAVPEIKARMLDAGCTAPLIGDFHYNGHLLLTKYPDCARALDKYRINPGNVGTKRRDDNFRTIIQVAINEG